MKISVGQVNRVYVQSIFRNVRINLIFATLLASLFTSNLPFAVSGDDDHVPPASSQSKSAYRPNNAPDNNEAVRFAIIGDYGIENSRAEMVADLVKSWDPDFITTSGDNNYPNGSAKYIDHNVGQYYHQYLYPYIGEYGKGADLRRFFPVLGNHDWDSIRCAGQECTGAYFDYFGIEPGDRYYTFQKGPVRFFMMDSDSNEPDGISALSNQAMWLREQLAQSDAIWNLVYMHHPPYSSGGNRSHELLQWPFAQWGADAVISGHSHVYERIEKEGMLFFVNGLGGKSTDHFRLDVPSWIKFRYNREYGAMLVKAEHSQITFQFTDRFGTLIDSHTVVANPESESAWHPAANRQSIAVAISNAGDDSHQHVQSGMVESNGYVLKMGNLEAGKSVIGLRFENVSIPPGAKIVDAKINLINQRREDTKTTVTIQGEKACSAASFGSRTYELTSRPKTSARVVWDEVDEWTLVGQSYTTPDITPIVSEIINYRGWQSGNHMAFFLTGQGQRNVTAYELQPQAAAQLHVTFEQSEQSTQSIAVQPASNLDHALFLPVTANYVCSPE